MLVNKTLNRKISDFLNSNTYFCLHLYSTLNQPYFNQMTETTHLKSHHLISSLMCSVLNLACLANHSIQLPGACQRGDHVIGLLGLCLRHILLPLFDLEMFRGAYGNVRTHPCGMSLSSRTSCSSINWTMFVLPKLKIQPR